MVLPVKETKIAVPGTETKSISEETRAIRANKKPRRWNFGEARVQCDDNHSNNGINNNNNDIRKPQRFLTLN